MMGEIVSLKRRRKQKARLEKQAEAAANRIKFGRAKKERVETAAMRALDGKRLDGHKRDE